MAHTATTCRASPPAIWPAIIACGLAALSLDLSSIHCAQHSDSFLYALISLYRWTPFFWEQNRVGMLVPLLVMPVKNPLFNLLVQDAIYIFAGLTAPVLLARYMLRDATSTVVGLLSATAFVVLAPRRYCFEYLIDTQYGVWLSLGLMGLIMLEAREDGFDRPRAMGWRRGVTAWILIALAHWVYCTAAMFLGALVVCRALFLRAEKRRRQTQPAADAPPAFRPWPTRWHWLRGETSIALALLSTGFGVGLLLMRLAPSHDTRFTALPMTDWPGAWYWLAHTTWQALAPQWWPAVLAGGALLGLVAAVAWRTPWQTAQTWRSAGAMLAAAAIVALFLGTRQWVGDNQYNLRYLLPSALIAATASIAVAIAPWGVWQSNRVWCGRFAAALLVAAALFRYGLPSLAAARGALAGDSQSVTAQGWPVEIRADDVVASGCTHLVGGYWRVWPAVFRANWALYERGAERVVWGVTERSGPTSRYFQSVPRDQTRIGVYIAGDDDAPIFLDHYGLTPVDRGEPHGSIALFKPLPVAVMPVDEIAGGSP
jgi:hypothetical protein